MIQESRYESGVPYNWPLYKGRRGGSERDGYSLRRDSPKLNMDIPVQQSGNGAIDRVLLGSRQKSSLFPLHMRKSVSGTYGLSGPSRHSPFERVKERSQTSRYFNSRECSVQVSLGWIWRRASLTSSCGKLAAKSCFSFMSLFSRSMRRPIHMSDLRDAEVQEEWRERNRNRWRRMYSSARVVSFTRVICDSRRRGERSKWY